MLLTAFKGSNRRAGEGRNSDCDTNWE